MAHYRVTWHRMWSFKCKNLSPVYWTKYDHYGGHGLTTCLFMLISSNKSMPREQGWQKSIISALALQMDAFFTICSPLLILCIRILDTHLECCNSHAIKDMRSYLEIKIHQQSANSQVLKLSHGLSSSTPYRIHWVTILLVPSITGHPLCWVSPSSFIIVSGLT